MNLKEIKLLYLSCHSVLEWDEISLLHNRGIEVFSPGAYVEPANPGDTTLRPGIPDLVYRPEILEEYNKISQAHIGEDAKNFLSKELMKNFNIVMIMHIPRWIENNWNVIKDKIVIWRSIGQSTDSVEKELQKYRAQGLKIVRMSPTEESIPGYLGSDALIRFYKNDEELNGWTGENRKVINVSQALFGSNQTPSRGSHMSLDVFKEVVNGLPWNVYGNDNDFAGDNNGGRLSYEDLKNTLRTSRVFFYLGTQPSPYTLGLIEAMMTGIPIVSVGSKLGTSVYSNQKTWEMEQIIQNGVNGFVSDDPTELRRHLQELLENRPLAEEISRNGRKTAIELFGKQKALEDWTRFFNNL